jgi:hypothetical protein
LCTKSVSIIAGSGTSTTPVINGNALNSTFGSWMGPLAFDYIWKKLYICDTNNHTIRVLDIQANTVSNFTGRSGTSGTTNGSLSTALFNKPSGLFIKYDQSNNPLIYVTEYNNNIVNYLRKIVNNFVSNVITLPVNYTSGIIINNNSHYTGNNISVYRFDLSGFITSISTVINGATTGNQFGFDSNNVVYFCDYNNNRIMSDNAGQINILSNAGVVLTIPEPSGLCVDENNNIYVISRCSTAQDSTTLYKINGITTSTNAHINRIMTTTTISIGNNTVRSGTPVTFKEIHGIAYNRNDKCIYLSNSSPAVIFKYNL